MFKKKRCKQVKSERTNNCARANTMLRSHTRRRPYLRRLNCATTLLVVWKFWQFIAELGGNLGGIEGVAGFVRSCENLGGIEGIAGFCQVLRTNSQGNNVSHNWICGSKMAGSDSLT